MWFFVADGDVVGLCKIKLKDRRKPLIVVRQLSCDANDYFFYLVIHCFFYHIVFVHRFFTTYFWILSRCLKDRCVGMHSSIGSPFPRRCKDGENWHPELLQMIVPHATKMPSAPDQLKRQESCCASASQDTQAMVNRVTQTQSARLAEMFVVIVKTGIGFHNNCLSTRNIQVIASSVKSCWAKLCWVGIKVESWIKMKMCWKRRLQKVQKAATVGYRTGTARWRLCWFNWLYLCTGLYSILFPSMSETYRGCNEVMFCCYATLV